MPSSMLNAQAHAPECDVAVLLGWRLPQPGHTGRNWLCTCSFSTAASWPSIEAAPPDSPQVLLMISMMWVRA